MERLVVHSIGGSPALATATHTAEKTRKTDNAAKALAPLAKRGPSPIQAPIRDNPKPPDKTTPPPRMK
jgi:hypothetical protein